MGLHHCGVQTIKARFQMQSKRKERVMSNCVTYYLNFRSPIHLGRRGIGLEETAISIPADTLFSAICQTWRTFYGEDNLTDFLDQYETGEPFMLTSAFPFAPDIRFFPKPLIDLKVNADDDRKKIKRVRYLSENRFRQVVNGEILFDPDTLVDNGQLWIHDADKCPPTVWKTDTRPRVTLDRQSSASEIWHLKAVKFGKDCGLWFDAKFEAEEIQTHIETILRVLGDTGIGGERSAGYGLFDFHSQPAEPAAEQEASRFVTLSPICPRDADQLNILIQGDDVSYTLEERSGWIGSAEASSQRRQQVWMFAEGSVLNGNGAQVGRLIDLKPEACPHPVWRYAYAWPIKYK
ncbi:type III-A CRISPR-associated RAMP protein Csm4 [Candidatus Poribacteria bacterium]|nr:MAG: type III-A CRISPR-associated RAMP protein Csm4 [Candidatus Poribacteria bacterium]